MNKAMHSAPWPDVSWMGSAACSVFDGEEQACMQMFVSMSPSKMMLLVSAALRLY